MYFWTRKKKEKEKKDEIVIEEIKKENCLKC